MRRILVLVILVLCVQACGTRGALYLPPPEPSDNADTQQKKK
jgi:predicted small lipoprotein YifL